MVSGTWVRGQGFRPGTERFQKLLGGWAGPHLGLHHLTTEKPSGKLSRERNLGLSPIQEAPGLLGALEAYRPLCPLLQTPLQLCDPTKAKKGKKKEKRKKKKRGGKGKIRSISKGSQLSLVCSFLGLFLSRRPTDFPSWVGVKFPPERALVPPEHKSQAGHLPKSIPASWAQLLPGPGRRGAWRGGCRGSWRLYWALLPLHPLTLSPFADSKLSQKSL